MRPGDVVVLKTKIVEGAFDRWSVSMTSDCITLIEGKAHIDGCVLARGHKGEIHCINPDLFEVLYTAEEAVAKKLMEPEPVQFEPVSHDKVMSRLHQAMAKAMAVNLDDMIINGPWKRMR